MNSPAIAVAFGSRAGSYTALVVFGVLFAILGVVVCRSLGRRGQVHRRTAAAIGASFFLLPLCGIYASSLGGFYTVRVERGLVVLRYLYPWRVGIPVAEIVGAESRYAFRSRWRLRLAARDGAVYESATTDRATVDAAANELRQLAKGSVDGR